MTLLPINVLSRKLRKRKTLDTSTSNANIFIFTHHFAALVENQIAKDLLSLNVPRNDGNFAPAARRGKANMAEVELDDVCAVMMLKDKHNSINS